MADYQLSVEVSGDASDMQREFQKAQKAAEDFQKTIYKRSKDNPFGQMSQDIANTSAKLKSFGDGFSNVGAEIKSVGQDLTKYITTPIIAGAGLAVKAFADYEQAVGGVETLFKKSADTVIKNSEKAYRTAGVSGTKYMEQVTSFSATLLQGLGGDTAKAAAYADKAIIDMSDNANKMGTDIGLIQNAYQGFAKGNFIMLDNLKLGFGGTKEEMQRLLDEAEKLTGIDYDINNFSDIIEAIHVIQQELGITGTTAKEASTTISGSFGQMKSAFDNLLGGLGTNNADIKALLSDLEETVKIFAQNVSVALKNIWDNLPLSDFQKFGLVVAAVAGPVLMIIGGLTIGIGSFISALGTIGTAVSGVVGWFGTLTSAGGALAGIFSSFGAGGVIAIFGGIALAVAGVAGAFVSLWNSSEQFRTSVGILAETVTVQFQNLLSAIQPIVDPIIGLFTQMWNSLVTILQPVIAAIIPIITSIVSIVGNVVTTILAIVVPIFATLIGYITAWIATVTPILSSIISVTMMIITTIISVISTFVATASGFIQALVAGIGSIISPIVDFFGDVFSSVSQVIQNTFKGITNFITTAISTIGNVINKLTNVVSSVFGNIKNTVNSIMSGVQSKITGVFNSIRNSWSGLTGFVQGVFNGISSAVSSLVNQVKGFVNGVIGGINSAISIINKIPGVSIGAIPYLYRGTDNWQGGFARMNEGGRGELTYLPGGSVVVPHDISMKYARESAKANSGVVVVNDKNSFDKQAMRMIKEALNRPVVLSIDGQRFARATGDGITKYQASRDMLRSRMRGEII